MKAFLYGTLVLPLQLGTFSSNIKVIISVCTDTGLERVIVLACSIITSTSELGSREIGENAQGAARYSTEVGPVQSKNRGFFS